MLLLAVGCAGPQEPAAVTDEGDATLLQQGSEYTERFYRGEIDLLYDEFSPGLRQELSLEQFSTIHQYVGETFGTQLQIVREDVATSDEYRAFIRWARFDKTEQIIEIRWTLRRDDDSIAEFWIRPAQAETASAGSS